MKHVFLTLALSLLLLFSADAQDVTYAGSEARLTLSRITDQTVELLLSPVSNNGTVVPEPESNILIDYPRQVLWQGRSLPNEIERTVGDLTISVSTDPLSVTIRRGEEVVQRFSWTEEGYLQFRTEAPVFGMGEGGPQYDRRGYRHTMRDGNASFKLATHGAFIATPFLIGMEGWSLFVHHPISRGNVFDLRGGRGEFQPDEEVLNQPMKLLVTAWEESRDIFSEYARYAGQTPMPPKWSLGYMQSHRTLEDSEQIREIARTFREKNLPADALIYLGTGFAPTGWNEGHGSFEFNSVVFDEPAEIISDLHDLNFKTALHVYSPPRGLHGTSMETNSDDPTHITNYWAEHEPVFELGVDGWWPDGGENLSSESRVARHRMYRIAPLLERPNERPWSLHRTGYSGVHRYGGWIWSGDPSTTWETLETHIAVGLNHSVSLTPHWGTDIAGFVPTTEFTGELYLRWLQFAAFTSSFRAHGRTWQLRLPWGWNRGHIGPPESSIFEQLGGYPDPDELRNALVEPIARQYMQLRYRLLPYNYTLFRHTHDTGLPPMRAMWLHYPDDTEAVRQDDQYLWGRDLLVAPVYTKGANNRSVYLPEGRWYDFWTNEKYAGGQVISRQVDLATMPLFVRAGTIIPLDPVRQYTGEEVSDPTTIQVYPGMDGEFRWYQDDGQTLDYQNGEYSQTLLQWDDSTNTLTVAPDPESKGQSPPARTLRIKLMTTGQVQIIDWDGKPATVSFSSNAN